MAVCICTLKPILAATPARSISLPRPATVNGAPLSETKVKAALVPAACAVHPRAFGNLHPTGGMSADRVVRLDPKMGTAIKYLMPTGTNMRTVYVDNSTTPVTFWVGSNHAHALVKVEPLD